MEAKTLTKIIHGSFLYGSNTETSDRDFKGVYLPSAQDILLGRGNGVKQTDTKADKTVKNSADDIDDSSYSLAKFIKLVCDGDTSGVEILLAPEEFRLETSPEFEEIYDNRMKLLNRQSKGFVGYCRSQSARYSAKGTRLTTARNVITMLEKFDKSSASDINYNYSKVGAFWPQIEDFVKNNEHSSIEILTMPNGIKIRHLVVCGKMLPYTNSIKSGLDMYRPMVDEYGARAKQAADNKGVDWKAVSHAVRVGGQAIELMKTGNLTFPRPDSQYLLDIKQGKLEYKEVGDHLDKLLAEVEIAAQNSVLPEHSDVELAESIVMKFHRNQIV